MRFIERTVDGKLLYWVDETSSYALIGGALYRDDECQAV